jgi:hypothetical protein
MHAAAGLLQGASAATNSNDSIGAAHIACSCMHQGWKYTKQQLS